MPDVQPPNPQRFHLEPGPAGWVEAAPIAVHHHADLVVPVADAFAVLADHERWPEWFQGMRKARVDLPTDGLGTVRTVWVGPMTVQERFTTWDPESGVGFDIVGASLPGLRHMAERWSLTPTPGGCALDITIAVEPKGPMRLLTPVLGAVFKSATKGGAGIADHVVKRGLEDFAP